MYVPTVVIVALSASVREMEPDKAPLWIGITILALALLVILMLPWSLWTYKRYQHQHYALGQLQTQFYAPAKAFYKLSLKILGCGVLAFALPLLLIFVAFITTKQFAHGSLVASLASMLPLIGMLLVLVSLKPYAIARTQNLVWNQTGSQDLQFHSDLRFKSLFWLTAKNWLLVLITLGFYWPFAAVAVARMRLQATSILSHIDPDNLVGQRRDGASAAVGDAAGDMLGIDFGI